MVSLARKCHSHDRLDLDCGFNVDTGRLPKQHETKKPGMCWKKYWSNLQTGLPFQQKKQKQKRYNILTCDSWFAYS